MLEGVGSFRQITLDGLVRDLDSTALNHFDYTLALRGVVESTMTTKQTNNFRLASERS